MIEPSVKCACESFPGAFSGIVAHSYSRAQTMDGDLATATPVIWGSAAPDAAARKLGAPFPRSEYCLNSGARPSPRNL